MEENKFKDKTPINNNAVYIWSIIENIATISVISCLFWLTESAWCFLFLINLNRIVWNFNNNENDNKVE